MLRLVANINTGDETSLPEKLTFRIYNNNSLYHSVGSASSDPNVTILGTEVTIVNIPSTAGTTYNISITAVDEAGNEQPTKSNVVTVNSADLEKPTKPVLSYSNVGTETVDIQATATDNVKVVSFDIYIDSVLEETVPGASLVHTITGLTPEENYDVFVVATDTAGNKSSASNIVNFTMDSVPVTVDGFPVLYNFRINNDYKNRVLFDSTGDITGLSLIGFAISGKTISSVTVNSGGLSGYFTVSAAFTYWDNNTIRLGNHTDLNDVNSKLHNFTLSYIVNNISEPLPTGTVYYVNGAVTSSGDGKTEATAFKTVAEGITALSGGGKLWVKAYNYGDVNLDITSAKNGTATVPTVIEGYKTSVGGVPTPITSNYYDYGVTMSSAEMPLFEGTYNSSTSLKQKGARIRASYFIMKNMQFTKYSVSGVSLDEAASDIVLDRINVYSISTSASTGYGINAAEFNSELTRLRILNSVSINCTEAMFQVTMNFGLIDNCKAYDGADDVTRYSGDYYFQLQGNSSYTRSCSNNIVRNCVAHKKNAAGFAGHGFGTKYINEYNLFELNFAANQTNSFLARHSQCKYNVWKDSVNDNRNLAYKNGSTGFIGFSAGPSWNVMENLTSYDTRRGLNFANVNEDPQNSNLIAENNVVRNCTFNKMSEDWMYVDNSDPGTTSSMRNNKIYNCTINDVAQYLFRLYYIDGADTIVIEPNNEIKNCLFSDITNHYRVSGTLYQAPNFIQEANNYWDFWGTNGTPPAGTLNQSVNPLYADLIDLKPTAALGTIDAMRINGVWYDQDKKERAEMTTIGAVKHDSESIDEVEPPAVYTPTRYVSSSTGNDANDGLTADTAWATLDKFDNMVLPENTIVGLKRGDTFTGRISRSDKTTSLVVTPYGSGAKPIINTFGDHILTFTASGTTNVWQAPAFTSNFPKRLWMDGVEILGGDNVVFADLGKFVPDQILWQCTGNNVPLYVYSTTNPSSRIFRYADYQIGIDIVRTDNVTIDNIDVRGGQTSTIRITDGKNCVIKNCDILLSTGDGITVDGYTVKSASIKIQNNNLDTMYELDYNQIGTYVGSTAVSTGDGVIVYECNGGEISNNTFRNWGHAGVSLTAKEPYGTYQVQSFKVFGNYFTLDTNMTYGCSYGPDRDSFNHEFYNNTSERTKVCQFNGHNNHFHHNVMRNFIDSPLKADNDDTGHGIVCFDYAYVSNSNVIENNIIDNCESGGIDIGSDTSGNVYGHIIRNNIINNCGAVRNNISFAVGDSGGNQPHDLIIENNIIYNQNTGLTVKYNNIVMTVEEFNATVLNNNVTAGNLPYAPLFAASDDYHLSSTSPAINSGVACLSTKDRDGNTIPFTGTAIDIGGYESTSLNPPTLPPVGDNNIVNNGTFDNGDSWSIFGGQTTISGGTLNINSDGTDTGVNQFDIFELATYEYSVDVNIVSGQVRMTVAGEPNIVWGVTTGWETKTGTITVATLGGADLTIKRQTACSAQIDNVVFIKQPPVVVNAPAKPTITNVTI